MKTKQRHKKGKKWFIFGRMVIWVVGENNRHVFMKRRKKN